MSLDLESQWQYYDTTNVKTIWATEAFFLFLIIHQLTVLEWPDKALQDFYFFWQTISLFDIVVKP